MEARSKLVSDLRELIWPGWDIEQSINDLFGCRYLFFPLSPVGLNEPGERDVGQKSALPLSIANVARHHADPHRARLVEVVDGRVAELEGGGANAFVQIVER